MDELLKVGENVIITIASGDRFDGIIKDIKEDYIVIEEKATSRKQVKIIFKKHIAAITFWI